MIIMPTTLVADRRSDFLRHSIQVFDQILNFLASKIRKVCYRLVEVGDISSVMLIVMNFHRARIDVWFKRVKRIRQRRQSERSAWRSGGTLSRCGADANR